MDANEYFYILTLAWRDDDGVQRWATATGTRDVLPQDEMQSIFWDIRNELTEETERHIPDVAAITTWIFQPNTGLYRA